MAAARLLKLQDNGLIDEEIEHRRKLEIERKWLLPIIGESVFLFGIVSFDYEGVEEENEIAKFKAKKLNVSNGRVTKVSETICEHNAEVVKGEKNKLKLS